MRQPSDKSRRYSLPGAAILATIVFLGLLTRAIGQEMPKIPSFWDPQERFIKPNVKDMPRLRFLTTTDFPPFSFVDKDKRLAGFHFDLARAICAELEVMPVCQIQALPFGELAKALQEKRGEAIIAGLAATAESRQSLAFSRPYFWLPARFVARRDAALEEPLVKSLAESEVGVVEGSSHEAMAVAKFGRMRLRLFDSQQSAIAALDNREIDAIFADGLTLAFWLQSGSKTAQCCQFVGGAYLSTPYLGNGMAIALPKGEVQLERAINYALRTINDRGTFAELYLRYFPIGLF